LIESRLVEGSRRMREADQSMFALPSEENATASYSDGIEHTFLASSPVDLALYAPSCSSNTWRCQSRQDPRMRLPIFLLSTLTLSCHSSPRSMDTRHIVFQPSRPPPRAASCALDACSRAVKHH
jgi:hypothetical protein